MILGIPIVGDFLSSPVYVCRHHLYDTVDRLHFLVTAYLLAFLVALTGARQHFGNPIDCMVPKEMDEISAWRSYIHNFCLFYGTYRYKFNETSYEFNKQRDGNAVNYYQWVPFFFAFQMFCFILPHWIWTWMQKLLYLDMELIVEHTNELLFEKNDEGHKKKLTSLIGYAYDHFKYRRLHKIGYFSFIFMHPAFACILYIFTKLLFLVNVIIQLKLISLFLGFNSWMWGFQDVKSYIVKYVNSPSVYDLVYGRRDLSTFSNFKNFPILVACDFSSFQTIGGAVNSTIQCIIPMNVVNEKIFIGLWLWFVMLILVSICGLIKWLACMNDRRNSEVLIYQHVKQSNKPRKIHPFGRFGPSKTAPDHRYDFVHKFLGADGILLVRFMEMKSGVLKTQEVINGLFEKYCEDFHKPTKPVITNKGEKTDYSEVNFGADDEDYHKKI